MDGRVRAAAVFLHMYTCPLPQWLHCGLIRRALLTNSQNLDVKGSQLAGKQQGKA